LQKFGIVIVTYNSSDVIVSCLQSLFRSEFKEFCVVVVDNASLDSTVEDVERVALQEVGREQVGIEDQFNRDYDVKQKSLRSSSKCKQSISDYSLPYLTILQSGQNRGFAGGVNLGLSYLLGNSQISNIWILNPDCEAQPDTLTSFCDAVEKNPNYGMIGGRILYMDQVNQIQSDGGRINPWNGVCSNISKGQISSETSKPDSSEIDFVNGASILVSRRFIEEVGFMAEDYFLYYEEVDWAFRKGGLKIHYAEGAHVYHHGGSSIGSPTLRKSASALSNYFNFRSRIVFMRRFFPHRMLTTYIYSLGIIGKILFKDGFVESKAALYGLLNRPPPDSVTSRIGNVFMSR